MRMNRRAEGSFAETMIAMMVVTIALAAFMGVFAYSLHTQDSSIRISEDFVRDLRIEKGEIVGVDQAYIDEECSRRGYSAMVITVDTAGNLNECHLRLGQGNDHDFTSVSGIVDLRCDDGTVVIARYEVVAFV